MTKKTKSFRPKNAGSYSSKSFKKPKWRKVLRQLFLAILIGLLVAAFVGKIIHMASHLK